MSMSKHYIEKDGVPVAVDLRTWATWFQNDENRRVALTKVAPNVRVSTVFLGLDHSVGDGAPLIYETMIFGGPLDQEQDRYSTRKEALAGHARMVERARVVAQY